MGDVMSGGVASERASRGESWTRSAPRGSGGCESLPSFPSASPILRGGTADDTTFLDTHSPSSRDSFEQKTKDGDFSRHTVASWADKKEDEKEAEGHDDEDGGTSPSKGSRSTAAAAPSQQHQWPLRRRQQQQQQQRPSSAGNLNRSSMQDSVPMAPPPTASKPTRSPSGVVTSGVVTSGVVTSGVVTSGVVTERMTAQRGVSQRQPTPPPPTRMTAMTTRAVSPPTQRGADPSAERWASPPLRGLAARARASGGGSGGSSGTTPVPRSEVWTETQSEASRGEQRRDRWASPERRGLAASLEVRSNGARVPGGGAGLTKTVGMG